MSHAGENVAVDSKGSSWVVGTVATKAFPAGEWHDYRIIVRGNHHQHWVNGHLTADLVDHDPKGRSLEGVLALQLHKGKPMTVEFKGLKIKHLPDDMPLRWHGSPKIPPTAYGVRPQGKLPKDWKPPIYGEQ